jgi:P4 family phage/plasmid primase-like protien
MAVVIDKTQLERLFQKFPAVSQKKIEKFFLDKCEYYSSMPTEVRERFGFEKGVKEEWNHEIKDNLLLIDEEYIKEDKEDVDKVLNAWSIFSKKTQSKQLEKLQPYFFDRSGMFWLWDKPNYCWKLSNEVDILNMIEAATNEDIITSKNRAEIINSLKQQGRKNIPKEIEKTWIQFRDKIYDVKTGESFDASPEYFITNPIPFSVSGDPRTPKLDEIFEQWVGKDYVETLYEIIAYCLLPSYPLHRLFCFIGSGMNGKSKFLGLLRNFLGDNNICSTELDTLIHSRFEITRLHKKLVCQMGETNFDELSKTSIIKKLTGQDTIGFEYKNKNPFEDLNYAKILIATNNLPVTTDKTLGFYRRWLIIDFPNKFSEKKDILNEIPMEEYNNLATKSIINLNKILDKREFHNEGNIEERMKKYEDHSDFLKTFLTNFVKEDFGGHITKADFKKKFDSWCKEMGHRYMADNTLGKKMKEREYEWSRKSFDWLFDGKGGQLPVWDNITWKE